MAAAGRGDGFWRFSLAFYARPGVAPALIALQDSGGHDVNLILYALWLGAVRRRALDPAGLAAAVSAAAGLRDTAVALRRLRRRLRADPDPEIEALGRRVAALELAAERRVQYLLASGATPPAAAAADREAVAAANLALVLGDAAGAAEAAALREALSRFLRRR